MPCLLSIKEKQSALLEISLLSASMPQKFDNRRGGMLTGKQELIEKARALSLHGMNRDAWKRYDKGGSWYMR